MFFGHSFLPSAWHYLSFMHFSVHFVEVFRGYLFRLREWNFVWVSSLVIHCIKQSWPAWWPNSFLVFTWHISFIQISVLLQSGLVSGVNFMTIPYYTLFYGFNVKFMQSPTYSLTEALLCSSRIKFAFVLFHSVDLPIKKKKCHSKGCSST